MMAYPYLPSGGIFRQAVDQFRRSIPSTIDAATLKKLGIAPSNEGYVINTLKFIGVVNDDNARTEVGHDIFTTHEDEAFQSKFSELVRKSYADLFEVRGEDAWKLERDALVSFFRTSDKTSEIVGKRQAIAFTALAAISGMREEDAPPRKSAPRKASDTQTSKPTRSKKQEVVQPSNGQEDKGGIHLAGDASNSQNGKVGLTVRIEINLPANGSQETYDNIFQSIRKNLFP